MQYVYYFKKYFKIKNLLKIKIIYQYIYIKYQILLLKIIIYK